MAGKSLLGSNNNQTDLLQPDTFEKKLKINAMGEIWIGDHVKSIFWKEAVESNHRVLNKRS